MTLDTLEPTPTFDETANADAVDALAAVAADDDLSITVWGADWCGDCRSVLPDFAAALEAAGVPDDRVTVHEVDREKSGEGVEEYGVEKIPTIVVERERGDGSEELARFVERERRPAAQYLAGELRDAGVVPA